MLEGVSFSCPVEDLDTDFEYAASLALTGQEGGNVMRGWAAAVFITGPMRGTAR